MSLSAPIKALLIFGRATEAVNNYRNKKNRSETIARYVKNKNQLHLLNGLHFIRLNYCSIDLQIEISLEYRSDVAKQPFTANKQMRAVFRFFCCVFFFFNIDCIHIRSVQNKWKFWQTILLLVRFIPCRLKSDRRAIAQTKPIEVLRPVCK